MIRLYKTSILFDASQLFLRGLWIFPSHSLLSISFVKAFGAGKAGDWGKCSPDESNQLFGSNSHEKAASDRKFSTRHLWGWRSSRDLIYLCQVHCPLPSPGLFACAQEPNLCLKTSNRGTMVLCFRPKPACRKHQNSGGHLLGSKDVHCVGPEGSPEAWSPSKAFLRRLEAGISVSKRQGKGEMNRDRRKQAFTKGSCWFCLWSIMPNKEASDTALPTPGIATPPPSPAYQKIPWPFQWRTLFLKPASPRADEADKLMTACSPPSNVVLGGRNHLHEGPPVSLDVSPQNVSLSHKAEKDISHT